MFNIILFGITSFLTDISSEMVYPVLPIFLVSALGASPAILGLIEGVAESLASLLKVFSGYFSDRLKRRKPFTILGYAGSFLGKLILFIASGWAYVLAGRIADRVGKGIRTAPRDALIAQNSRAKERGKAFGLHRTMDSLGAVVGVTIAYFIIKNSNVNLRQIFFFSLFPALLGVLVLFFIKEKNSSQPATAIKPQFIWRGLDKRLRLFLICSFLFTLGNSSNQFLLLRARNLGSPLPQVILFYLVYNIAYSLSSYPAGRLSDKIGRKKILVLGYIFYGLVYLGFALSNSPGALWFLFGFYGLYIGFTEGTEKALVADVAPAESVATVIGLHATVVSLGLLLASLLAGLLWKIFGSAAPFYFGGVMGLCSSIGFYFVLRGL